MKSLLAISFITFATGAFAQEDLNMMKQRASSQIDKKMTNLRTAKDCVSNATTVEKFKACKYDMHEDMKMQKMEKMEEMKNRKIEE